MFKRRNILQNSRVDVWFLESGFAFLNKMWRKDDDDDGRDEIRKLLQFFVIFIFQQQCGELNI